MVREASLSETCWIRSSGSGPLEGVGGGVELQTTQAQWGMGLCGGSLVAPPKSHPHTDALDDLKYG